MSDLTLMVISIGSLLLAILLGISLAYYNLTNEEAREYRRELYKARKEKR